jgi:DNA-directed RNA polymerase subunit beta'
MSEQVDEVTGIAKRLIIDWRSTPRGADLRPAMVIKDKKGEILKTARGGDARALLPADAVLSVSPGDTGEGW